MAIRERIRYFRNLRGMTLKQLGMLVGFPERTADVRMAQYEAGTRSPKADMTNALAHVLEVSPSALNVPDMDTYIGLMHTLFALEDLYGLQIAAADREPCLLLDPNAFEKTHSLHGRFRDWLSEKQKLDRGEITKEEYDRWRYTYPAVQAKRTKENLDALRATEKEAGE